MASCETPQDGNNSPLSLYKGKNGSRFVSQNRERRRKRREEKTFEENFMEDVIDNGIAPAINRAVTPSYGGSCFVVQPLEDTSEIDAMIVAAYNKDKSCSKVFTGNKGNTEYAGLPYAKTFAYSMIQDMCNPSSGRVGELLSKPPLGKRDALSLSHFKNGAVSESDPKNLASTYALMYALGQRESGGNFKQGRDVSAKNFSSITTEAGMFQVSANTLDPRDSEPENFLRGIFSSYVGQLAGSTASEKGELCLNSKMQGSKETKTLASENEIHNFFGEKGICESSIARVKSPKFKSTQVSACFRGLMKACPSFAIKYSAGVARLNRFHNGPLVTREEYKARGKKNEGDDKKYFKPYPVPACNGIFQSIITNKAKICSEEPAGLAEAAPPAAE